MARVRMLLGLAGTLLWALGVSGSTAGAVEGTNGSVVFGLTNVWILHLTLGASNWSAMMPEEPSRGGAPFGRGPGERPGGRPEGGMMRGGPGGGAGAGTGAGAGGEPGDFGRDYPWSECTFEGGGVTLTNVAVRFKGNSSFAMSRNGLKRPLRLDFDRGAPGRTWLGVEELSLNNNLNDATQFREALAYEVCRQAGLPAPRTAFARVFLTLGGERTNLYLGMYTLVEPVEGGFLKARFGTKKGLLLKPERLPGLAYLGEDWNLYPARYQPKTDVKRADATRFIALTRLIAQADDATFERELPRALEVEEFLRYVAVTAWLANCDSFVGNGHNYYFFLPSGSGEATFIPWDLNEAFAGHPPGGPRRQQAEFSILRPQGFPNRLIERVLGNPTWSAAYRREIERLRADACEPNRLIGLARELARTVREAVSAESESARAAFERVALGKSGSSPVTGAGEPGPRGGFRPGASEDGSLEDWIRLRDRNVAEELAGQRTGTVPRIQRGPGGPGGPGPRRPGQPQMGGPGGLVFPQKGRPE